VYFIDVILPIPLKQTFTYEVNKDEAMFLRQGMRVAVPFGKSKLYTGIIYAIHQVAPQGYDTKSIDQILDENPIVNEIQIKHWEWMANYYMCTLGEVLRAALPNAFLLESETIITLIDKNPKDEFKLSDQEFLVLEALQVQSPLHINDIRGILDKKNVVSILQSLLGKGLIGVQEEVYEKYSPKIKRYIKLSSDFSTEENLKLLIDSLTRAPKQKQVLMTLFMLSSKEKKPIESVFLQKKSDTSSSVINGLVSKGVLKEYFIRKDRISYDGEDTSDIKKLSDAQSKALKKIKISFETKNTALLHGVTSSGKTEIYVQLIEEILKQKKQVLYMLPEIALTTQLISRLQYYFGEKISVYHSKYSISERVEVWNNVLENKPKAQVIIGARSSLFLPFFKLGLIIVDEEHEPSFKQYAPSPRYNGRDSAVVLAKLHNAKVLMGSATPSLESYYNAKNDRYGLITLKKRFGNVMMPAIELVVIKENQFDLSKFSDIANEALLQKTNESSSKRKPIQFKTDLKDDKLPPMEVDLHIHQLIPSTKGMDNFDILTIQMEHAKHKLEFAIKNRIPKLVFIHGVGEGVLKSELEFMFKNYHVDFYEASYKKYGLGATEVYVYQNPKN